MKRTVVNSDGGQGPTKARKSFDLGWEDRGDCDVDSTSGLDNEKEDHDKTNVKDIL